MDITFTFVLQAIIVTISGGVILFLLTHFLSTKVKRVEVKDVFINYDELHDTLSSEFKRRNSDCSLLRESCTSNLNRIIENEKTRVSGELKLIINEIRHTNELLKLTNSKITNTDGKIKDLNFNISNFGSRLTSIESIILKIANNGNGMD